MILHGTNSPVGTHPIQVRTWCMAMLGVRSDYTRDRWKINCPRCIVLAGTQQPGEVQKDSVRDNVKDTRR